MSCEHAFFLCFEKLLNIEKIEHPLNGTICGVCVELCPESVWDCCMPLHACLESTSYNMMMMSLLCAGRDGDPD